MCNHFALDVHTVFNVLTKIKICVGCFIIIHCNKKIQRVVVCQVCNKFDLDDQSQGYGTVPLQRSSNLCHVELVAFPHKGMTQVLSYPCFGVVYM